MKANEYKVMDLTLLLDTTLDVTNHLTAVEHHFHGAQLLSHERRKKNEFSGKLINLLCFRFPFRIAILVFVRHCSN